VTTYKGKWRARVEQEFEVEAETEEEAQLLIEREMSPQHVVELIDFECEITDIEEEEDVEDVSNA
jgi:hypothetical protein